MKVLMLGWEYPPHISGGLGTACEGLSLGLSRQKIEITFVVPKRHGDEHAPHMTLVSAKGDVAGGAKLEGLSREAELEFEKLPEELKKLINIKRIPSSLRPYITARGYKEILAELRVLRDRGVLKGSGLFLDEEYAPGNDHYGWDVFDEVERYARRVAAVFSGEKFDLIHAHDWMTYPAGVLLSELTGKPLVVHVHSLERDRSGQMTNNRIDEIERWGIQSADAVIAVSHYTKNIVVSAHSVSPEKVYVVHNGTYKAQEIQNYRKEHRQDSKIVLFLGRVTFQKGPDYFVEAAAKVVPIVPNVLFVMAGSGDMLAPMMRKVHELGITNNFFFPGFLRGPEVDQMFSLADVYVMPSVSEPFGISALEAISYETPVIISKQSGVAEVLSHALKVDFWDVDKLADLIINSLLHKELRSDLSAMARQELKRLHWDAAGKKTSEIYKRISPATI